MRKNNDAYLQSLKSNKTLSMLVRLYIRLYQINVKTAEPIGSKFGMGSHVGPRGEGYGRGNFLTIYTTYINVNFLFIYPFQFEFHYIT